MAIDLLSIQTRPFKRLIAISDIHGDLQALQALLDSIAPNDQDLIITLGDYIDRGHFSAQVIDLLVELHNSSNIISLRGNHDQWMINAKDSEANAEFWMRLGGTATLASYEEEAIHAVPSTHWKFLTETCIDIVETERHIFVHGYVEFDVPLVEQQAEKIQMLRHQDCAGHKSGKTIVCGHSATNTGLPEINGQSIAIETKAWLNAVDVKSGHSWRANSYGLCTEISIT